MLVHRRPRPWSGIAVAAVIAAVVSTVGLVLQSHKPLQAGERLATGGDELRELTRQVLHGAATEHGDAVADSLARDIALAEDTLARSRGAANDDDVAVSLGHKLRSWGVEKPRGAVGGSAGATLKLDAAAELVKEVSRATADEKRAARRERKARAGLLEEAALARTFKAERTSARTRLSSALRALADQEHSVPASALGIAHADDPSPLPAATEETADEALRADIARLSHDLGVSRTGAMARAKKLAAAQQKKHSGDKAKKSGVEAEVATLRRQLAAVRTKLARALHPAGGQMLGFNRKKEKQQYSATDLPEAVGVDKKHCLPPLVWSFGRCKTSPRGRSETADEEGRTCGRYGERSRQCRTFRRNERRKRKKYEKMLRKAQNYSYRAQRQHDAWKEGDKAAHHGRARQGSLDYDLHKALAGDDYDSEHPDAEFEKKLATLEKSLKHLDEWSRDIDPSEFVSQPQRYPHRSRRRRSSLSRRARGRARGRPGDNGLVDLGDNWISGFSDKHGEQGSEGDNVVPVDEAAMRPSPLSPFLRIFSDTSPDDVRKPMYAEHHMPKADAKVLKADKSQLRYANQDDAFGKHSPLEPKMEQLLYGDAHGLITDKNGFPSDVFPSTKEYHKQVSTTVTPQMYAEITARHHTPDWAKGHLDGVPDGLQVENLMSDDVEPAEAVQADAALKAHFRANTGEPVGDFSVRGWNPINMVDYETKWDLTSGKHDE